MDNNAQIPSVQNPPPAKGPLGMPPYNYPLQKPVQTNSILQQNTDNQTIPTTSSQTLQQNTNVGQTTQPVPVGPPQKKTQQVSISGHPEQGSMATMETDEDDDDKDDRVQVAKQEIARKETPTPIVQTHKEIDIRDELRNAGVSAEPDTDRKQLPEEPEQLGDDLPQNQQQATTAQLDDVELPMPYGEAQLAAKKERSIKRGISWIVRMIIRQWEKLKSQPES